MKLVMKILLTFLICILIAAPVMAAPICYAPDEAEAEQGLRLQNELLLVGMACGKAASYRQFIEAHNDLWQDYEETLQKFYTGKKSMSSAAAKKEISDLRVKFGNETGLRMGQISKPLYFRMHLQSFKDMKDKNDTQIRTKLRLSKTQHLSYPVCSEK